MLVGMGSSTVTLPLSAAALREVDIMGSFRYAGTWGTAIELLNRSWRLTQQHKSNWGFQEGGLGDVGRYAFSLSTSPDLEIDLNIVFFITQINHT